MGSLGVTCLLLVACTAFVDSDAQEELPFATCARDDPKRIECIKDAAENFVKNVLPNGLTARKRKVAGVDPLIIQELHFGKGKGQSLNVDLLFQNLQLFGIRNAKLSNVKYDVEHEKLVGHAVVPELRLESDYEVNGKVLVLPITGKGKCVITFYELKVDMVQTSEPYTKNGKKYLKTTGFHIKINPKKVHLHFENLFNGDEALGKAMNNVINENWQIFLEEMKPGIEEALGQVLASISNQLYSIYSYDEIYPATKN